MKGIKIFAWIAIAALLVYVFFFYKADSQNQNDAPTSTGQTSFKGTDLPGNDNLTAEQAGAEKQWEQTKWDEENGHLLGLYMGYWYTIEPRVLANIEKQQWRPLGWQYKWLGKWHSFKPR